MRISTVALCALTCAAVVSRSNAQSAASTGAPGATVPTQPPLETIAFAISGGISLGSYKAGVNWFLVESNKRLADHRFRERVVKLAPAHASMPPFVHLGAVAGASAGNINAIASSISWCRGLPTLDGDEMARADSAETSLMWKLWIPTGFQELEAPDANDIAPTDAGLLVRRFFEKALLPVLDTAMKDPALRPTCRVPVAVTLTSITPDTLRAGPILAPVQRHSVLAEFRTVPNARGGAFYIAPEELRSPAMGSLIFPTPVRDSVIATSAIFSVVQASSAFPVAFAPVEVRYFRYGDVRTGQTCPAGAHVPCARPRVGMFSDGGVFDNLPISLTVEVMRRNVGDTSQPRLHVMPIDPHSTNEAGIAEGSEDSRGEPSTGLAAVMRLLWNAVPSARAYELQMFTRSLDTASVRSLDTANARQTEVTTHADDSAGAALAVNGSCPRSPKSGVRPHACVMAAALRLSGSTRSFPLMGERMRAFGAFFGRPLREYDFYLGVFDGLRQFARVSICRDTNKAPTFSIADCETVVVRKMLLDDGLEKTLGLAVRPIGRVVLLRAALATRQLDSTEVSVEPASSFTGNERIVYELSAIRDASLKNRLPLVCMRRHPVDAILCDRDYIGMLAALHSALGRETLENGRRDPGDVDTVLLDVIRDPERFVDRLYTRTLWRQDRIERWLGEWEGREGTSAQPRTPSSERLVALTEAYYLSTNERYRKQYDPFPSSIPSDDKGPFARIARVAPQYLGAGLLMDVVAFGYRPTWYCACAKRSYTNPGVRKAVTVPALDLVRIDTRRSGGRFRGVAWHANVGAGLVLLLPKTSVSAIEIVPGFAIGSSGGQADLEDRFTMDVAARFVGNKFRLSVRRQPEYLWKPPGPRSIRGVIGIIGVNDVPGIVYWTYRLLRAH